jgi:hypothetical protein
VGGVKAVEENPIYLGRVGGGMTNVVQFRSKQELARSRNRREALTLLPSHVPASHRNPREAPPTRAHTEHGFYMRVDKDGVHMFTAYVINGRVSTATWKRGEWEAEILDTFEQLRKDGVTVQ